MSHLTSHCTWEQVGNAATELSDAYAELKLTPGDETGGEQVQRGTLKPSTLNPKWVRIRQSSARIARDMIKFVH